MKYDFTTCPDRHGKDAIAVDGIGGPSPSAPRLSAKGTDCIPMWIADMNFRTAPSVTGAMASRLEHPLFGYFNPSEEYFNSIIKWQETHNGASGLCADFISYENGVLGGVVSALAAISPEGGKVLVHAPTYVGFTGVLNSNGYEIVSSFLKQDEKGVWRMDYEDMEEKIRTQHITAAILCSPHNPCGRVWSREELKKAVDIFEKYGVSIISDEIWSDLTLYGNQHVPTQLVSEYAKMNTAAFYAPSKTFNLAGLVGSYRITYNPELNEKITAAGSRTFYNSMNVLSMHALVGAYTDEGNDWLCQLRETLEQNVDYACSHLNSYGVSCMRPEGTYMIFADCGEWCRKNNKTMDELLAAAWDAGAGVQDGRRFHGRTHLRINVALPMPMLEEAFCRLDSVLK